MPLTFTKEGTLKERKEIWSKREDCRACHQEHLVDILDLGVQYLPRFPLSPDLALPKAPLILTRCASCGLLQLRHTVEADYLFREYWYRSTVNASMRLALIDLVNHASTYKRSGAWLDIGANDGFTLKNTPRTFTRIACEPSHDFLQELSAIADRTITDYFSAEKVDREVDVITSAAMFYDVDDPHKFLADIAKTLKPDGVWINQLNDSPTMLQANAWDSVCHEHLCYYDLPVLAKMYAEHGLGIVGVSSNDVNGGSLRVVAVKGKHTVRIPELAQTADECEAFASRARKWKEQMTEIAQSVFAKSPTWVYGASTKGMVLLQYLDQHDAFVGAADKNTLKHSRYMAGSWTPILSEEHMRQEKPRYLMVLPWAFKKEFVSRERKARESGTTLVFPLPNIEFVQ